MTSTPVDRTLWEIAESTQAHRTKRWQVHALISKLLFLEDTNKQTERLGCPTHVRAIGSG